MPSYLVCVDVESDAQVTDLSATRVTKDDAGDLVFYEGKARLGSAVETEVARFRAGSWAYYYTQDDEQ